MFATRNTMDSKAAAAAVFAHNIYVAYIIASVAIQVLLNKSAPTANILLGVAGGAGLGYLASSIADGKSHKVIAVLLPVLAAICVTLVTASFIHKSKAQGKGWFKNPKHVGEAPVNGQPDTNDYKGPPPMGNTTVTVENVKDVTKTNFADMMKNGGMGNVIVTPANAIGNLVVKIASSDSALVKPVKEVLKGVINAAKGK
jgi:hypothetical protein